MGNYELRSRLGSLESELSQLERVNAELRSELSTVENGVYQAHKNLENYNDSIRTSLDRCHGTMHTSHQRVMDSIALQGDIERLYVRFKNMELANKKIRSANNKKYYDFANYRTVRKIVRGMMDNLDVQMVSDDAITKAIEIQHLQTPDYWLTCVLISTMAWRNDDRDLADRAMARALKLDKKNSAIFYMLLNLRMGRGEAALKWFNIYQECALQGSDQRTFLMLFSLVSNTIAENVDDQTKNEIFTFIKRVIAANMKASGYSEDRIVSLIRDYFDKRQPCDPLPYPLLRKCCGEVHQLGSVLMQAKNNITILEFVLRTLNVSVEEKNTFLKEYIDEIIAKPNDVEKGVYDEIAYNELVIRLEGEAEEANRQFEEEQIRKSNDLDLIGEMIDWIYERDAQEVNGQVRLSMFMLTKDLQVKAVTAHAENYRVQRKTDYPISIGEYSTVASFKREDEEMRKIYSFYTKKKETALAEIKKWPAYIVFGIAAAALIGSIYLSAWLLIVTAGGVGYGIFTLLSNRSKKRRLEQVCAESIRATGGMLRQLMEEFKEYEQELDEYDAYNAQILDEINKS